MVRKSKMKTQQRAGQARPGGVQRADAIIRILHDIAEQAAAIAVLAAHLAGDQELVAEAKRNRSIDDRREEKKKKEREEEQAFLKAVSKAKKKKRRKDRISQEQMVE